MIETRGLGTGDEECFELFAEVFDPIISGRRDGYIDLDVTKLSNTKIDPTGNYTLSGFNLSPGKIYKILKIRYFTDIL